MDFWEKLWSDFEKKGVRITNVESLSKYIADAVKTEIDLLSSHVSSPDFRRMPLDMVNRPPHYNMGKIEVSDFIADQKMDFFEGNIVKYVSRHKFKNGLEDLKKAQWYLTKLIKLTEEAKNVAEKSLSEERNLK
jgi:hypothetical protein